MGVKPMSSQSSKSSLEEIIAAQIEEGRIGRDLLQFRFLARRTRRTGKVDPDMIRMLEMIFEKLDGLSRQR